MMVWQCKLSKIDVTGALTREDKDQRMWKIMNLEILQKFDKNCRPIQIQNLNKTQTIILPFKNSHQQTKWLKSRIKIKIK